MKTVPVIMSLEASHAIFLDAVAFVIRNDDMALGIKSLLWSGGGFSCTQNVKVSLSFSDYLHVVHLNTLSQLYLHLLRFEQCVLLHFQPMKFHTKEF